VCCMVRRNASGVAWQRSRAARDSECMDGWRRNWRATCQNQAPPPSIRMSSIPGGSRGRPTSRTACSTARCCHHRMLWIGCIQPRHRSQSRKEVERRCMHAVLLRDRGANALSNRPHDSLPMHSTCRGGTPPLWVAMNPLHTSDAAAALTSPAAFQTEPIITEVAPVVGTMHATTCTA
jgi:hypothetical protein